VKLYITCKREVGSNSDRRSGTIPFTLKSCPMSRGDWARAAPRESAKIERMSVLNILCSLKDHSGVQGPYL
jgi:hypothetical protein